MEQVKNGGVCLNPSSPEAEADKLNVLYSQFNASLYGGGDKFQLTTDLPVVNNETTGMGEGDKQMHFY